MKSSSNEGLFRMTWNDEMVGKDYALKEWKKNKFFREVNWKHESISSMLILKAFVNCRKHVSLQNCLMCSPIIFQAFFQFLQSIVMFRGGEERTQKERFRRGQLISKNSQGYKKIRKLKKKIRSSLEGGGVSSPIGVATL